MTEIVTAPPSSDQTVPDAGRLILRDGTSASIRLSQPDDLHALQIFFHRLSPESRRLRFSGLAEPAIPLLEKFCDSSEPRRLLTLVVIRTVAGESRIVAAGTYVARDSSTAEVALAVDDAFQGKGVGTLLLERLALAAVRNGFTRFWAVTSLENQQMLEVFRDSGFPIHSRSERGFVDIDLSVVPSEASASSAAARDRIATIASVRPFFEPRSVAVVGASRTPSSLGYRVLDAIVTTGFRGPVYPVNPAATTVRGLRALRSIREAPEPVDLAVITVPADRVLDVVDDCAARGVRAIVVITAGFAEIDEKGRGLQQRLVERVRGYGMRMIGPNCMGLVNADPAVRLNASFSPVFPPAGPIAMSSQSGALGLAILALARERRLGLSTFVSIGNKADVSSNDLLQYWEDDPKTRVVLLYLESFGNPRRFARIARRVSHCKPIIAMKAGRTEAGRRAAGSHTAALAASDTAVDALFRQTGVIRAETLEEMFDLAACLGTQPLPPGRRVGIVTNAGGPGVLCVDACGAAGLIVPQLDETTRAKLAELLSPVASVGNPVDMIASAGPAEYRHAVETLLAAPGIDALIIVHIPIDLSTEPTVATAIREGVASGRLRSGAGKPVLACVLAERGLTTPIDLDGETIPTYPFPELAARALGKIAAYAEWRGRPEGAVPDLDRVNSIEAKKICQEALGVRGPGWLTASETSTVLNAVGLPLIPGRVVQTADEAATFAKTLGYPIALKLASRVILHKSEAGCVRLNLVDEQAVRSAFEEIRARVASIAGTDAFEGVLVQPMMTNGVEVIAGVATDPLFGPLIAFGLGGIHVEVMRDVCFRVAPLTDRDADEMITGIRGFPLLEGYRGHPPADIAAIKGVLLRVSRLVEEVVEIEELDLNPIFARAPGEGAFIADSRIRVGYPDPHHIKPPPTAL